MLAIGPGQVGKTSFLRRVKGLMKWDIDSASQETQVQTSTGQTEMEQVYVQYSRQAMSVTSASKWHLFENEKEVEELITALTQLIKEQTNAPRPTSFQPPPVKQVTEADSSQTFELKSTSMQSTDLADIGPPDIEIGAQIETDPTIANVAESVAENVPLSSDILSVFKEYQKLRTRCSFNPQKRATGQTDAIINIGDVGGQPAFLEMLPALTIGPAMYLVFMKLLQGLKTPYPVKYKTKGDLQATICKDYTYTTEEVIFTALSSIACFGHSDEEVEKYVCENSGKTSSLALVMGTFADEVTDENIFYLNENEQRLRQQLNNSHFYEDGLVEYSQDPKPSSIIFKVNNKSGGDEEVIKYRKLFEQLMQNKFRKYAIPVKWLELEICLRLFSKLKKVHIIHLSDCIEFGKLLKMDEQMVRAALQFLHKYIGLILYFPENEKLKNFVICDPQSLFFGISELIFEVYNPKKRRISASKCQFFIETGCFSLNDIKPIEEKRILPVEDFVEILLHLNIAARCKSMYFLPAVLRSAKEEYLAPQQDKSSPEPLCISFQTGYLPLGFVCALIARLTSEGTFELLGPEQECEIFKNKVLFRFRGRYNVTFVSWPKYCEFRISPATGAGAHEQYHSQNCCPLIRDTISNAIDHVIKLMTQNSVFHISQTYNLGFKCPNPVHASKIDHGHEPLAIFDLKNVNNIVCKKCSITPSLSQTMTPWFAPRILTTEQLSMDPQERQHSVGDKIVLSTTTTGAKPFYYQWFKDGSKLSDNLFYRGSTSSSLHIWVTSAEQGGMYYCEVSNNFGDRIHSCKDLVVVGKKNSVSIGLA